MRPGVTRLTGRPKTTAIGSGRPSASWSRIAFSNHPLPFWGRSNTRVSESSRLAEGQLIAVSALVVGERDGLGSSACQR